MILHEMSPEELKKPWVKRYIKETCRYIDSAVSQAAAWESRRLKVAHIFFKNAVTGKIERVRGISVKYEVMQRYIQKCRDDNPDRELLGMWVTHMLRRNHSKGRIPVLMPFEVLKLIVGGFCK